MKTPKTNKLEEQRLRERTPPSESTNVHSGVLTRSRARRLSESSTTEMCEITTPSRRSTSVRARSALTPVEEIAEKVSVTPKSSRRSSKTSKKSSQKEQTQSKTPKNALQNEEEEEEETQSQSNLDIPGTGKSKKNKSVKMKKEATRSSRRRLSNLLDDDSVLISISEDTSAAQNDVIKEENHKIDNSSTTGTSNSKKISMDTLIIQGSNDQVVECTEKEKSPKQLHKSERENSIEGSSNKKGSKMFQDSVASGSSSKVKSDKMFDSESSSEGEMKDKECLISLSEISKPSIGVHDSDSESETKDNITVVKKTPVSQIQEDKIKIRDRSSEEKMQVSQSPQVVSKKEILSKPSPPKTPAISSPGRRQLLNNYRVGSSPAFKSQLRNDMNSESSDSDSDAESRKAIKESAQKRIIQNISTSESESRKFVKPVSKTKKKETSDSDSAPDIMSFSAGRKLAMDSLKNAVESIQKEKQKRKEKRRQRLEKYKQQKEEKLIRLKEKRASQEDASCSSSEESGYEEEDALTSFAKSSKKQGGVKREKENLDDAPLPKVKKFHSEDEAEPRERKEKKRKYEDMNAEHFGNLKKLPNEVLENLPDQIPVKFQKRDGSDTTSREKLRQEKHNKAEKKRAVEMRSRSDVDYIPLKACGATDFGVVPLDSLLRAPVTMAQQAADFRQRMLFGDRIKRESVNTKIAYQQKMTASGKDRFVR